MKVRIGRIRTGDKLAVHAEIDGATCSTLRPVTIEITSKPADAALCKTCAKRLAAAQHRNNMLTIGWSAALDKLFAETLPQVEVDPAGFNPEYDEERAEIARRWAAQDDVEPLTAFGVAARAAGYRPATRTAAATSISSRRRMALHRSFAHAA